MWIRRVELMCGKSGIDLQFPKFLIVCRRSFLPGHVHRKLLVSRLTDRKMMLLKRFITFEVSGLAFMRNTIIVSILLFIAVVVASVFYFGDLNKEEKKSVKPINYLPSDTYLITSIVNDATTDNIFKDFEIFEAVLGHSFQDHISQLKQQLLRNKDIASYLTDQEMFVSFHPEKEGIATLFSIPTTEKIDKETIIEILPKIGTDYQVQQQDTLEVQLFSYKAAKSDSTFYVSYLDDIFFATYSKELLLKTLVRKTPKFDEKQVEFFNKNNSRNAPFTVYLAQQNLPAIVDKFRRNRP